MTFTRGSEASRVDNFIYLGIQKAIATKDPTYHKWVNDKPVDKKAKRVFKELEIDMVHKPLEPRKKAHVDYSPPENIVEHDEEEEEPVIEASSVPFNAVPEQAPPPQADAPEPNLREAADILESMREASPVPPPPPPRREAAPPRADGEQVEIDMLKESNAELRGELRGVKLAVTGYKELSQSKDSQIKIIAKTKAEVIMALKRESKAQLSEIKNLKQQVKEYKDEIKYHKRLTYQLRGQLGSSQREVNRPVREENARLAKDKEWLQDGVIPVLNTINSNTARP